MSNPAIKLNVMTRIGQSLPFVTAAILFMLIFGRCGGKDQEANVTLRVKVKGSNGEMVFLNRITIGGLALLDSAKVDSRGEVAFELFTHDFDFLLLNEPESEGIMLLVEKGENAEIFTTHGRFAEDYSLKGSGGSALLNDLEKKKEQTLQELDSLGRLWYTERYASDNALKKALFDSISGVILKSHKSALESFMERYPESPAQIIAVYQVLRPGQPVFTLEEDSLSFRNISAALSERYPGNEHVKDLRQRYEEFDREQSSWREREKQLRPGNPAPPFDLFNTAGEKVALPDFQGRYVLVYFWDARNQECWEVNRKLSEIYRQYRSRGLEICGIYTGEDKQLFYNAIRIDGLPWIHLFGNSLAEKQYNVKKVPALLLVDREGKILLRNITPDELAAKLPWLLPSGKKSE